MHGSFTHEVPSPKDFEFTESGRPTLVRLKPKKVFDKTFGNFEYFYMRITFDDAVYITPYFDKPPVVKKIIQQETF
jgi:hypothetical protein